MVDWQDGIEDICRTYIHEGLHAVGIKYKILMSQHYCLGGTCCTRCEQEGCKVLAFRLLNGLRPYIWKIENV